MKSHMCLCQIFWGPTKEYQVCHICSNTFLRVSFVTEISSMGALRRLSNPSLMLLKLTLSSIKLAFMQVWIRGIYLAGCENFHSGFTKKYSKKECYTIVLYAPCNRRQVKYINHYSTPCLICCQISMNVNKGLAGRDQVDSELVLFR